MKCDNTVIKKGNKFKVIRLEGRYFTYFVLPIDVEIQDFYTKEKEAYDEFLDKEIKEADK